MSTRKAWLIPTAVMILAIMAVVAYLLSREGEAPTPLRMGETLYVRETSDPQGLRPQTCIAEEEIKRQGRWPIYQVGVVDRIGDARDEGVGAEVRFADGGSPGVFLSTPQVPSDAGYATGGLFVAYESDCFTVYRLMQG